MHTSVTELGTVLSVWAHPDDETYVAGGLMAAARAAGQRVVCATATAGELGAPDPAAWSPERLGAVRRWEAAAAMAVLGVDEHEIAGLPDGGLHRVDAAGREWACRLLERVRPDTIATFDANGGTFHPDHIAVHRWVTDAWRALGRPCRLLYEATTTEHLAKFGSLFDEWNIYMTDARPAGVPVDELAVHLVLEGAELDRKLTALRAMATQTADLVAALGVERYAELVREEAFVAARPAG
jgi:LmbE family N-acetylglucosaminyl deacetylase